ncbi:MAG: hypothetical protein UY92_C0010G0036 [Candidatus Magasanikbacteria bacterium GW2011_GWA2_56_11]|uniref:DUF305 domain-containing protein n=1 Tax=Candidatus Magasanikbacteria bacterium GW2011_GWA2_56_11 TaxID=1619044 RepID=A0A0G1YG22_9BACT|nr:MAG: hypothetical protein UY92_C0010G0036 [Candidatus Magasanikbacteria bacterium GW2011_GWA2_56_11]
MTNEKHVWGLAGLLLGIAVMVLSSALWAAYQPQSSMMPRGLMRWNQGMMGNWIGSAEIDAHFIEQMISHHESAVEMAELALERAEHEELKALAAEIKDAQTREIENMRGWYRQWYGKEADEYWGSGPMMGRGTMGRMMRFEADIQNLETAESFDKAFIEAMIPHHGMAVMMAQMAVDTAKRSEIRSLSREIIESQSEEIEKMRQWHEEWY